MQSLMLLNILNIHCLGINNGLGLCNALGFILKKVTVA